MSVAQRRRGTGSAVRIPALRAVVIGAGLAGLATALRLLAAGHRVTVVERQPELGGRAGQIRERGYTFDAGPSLITMPWLLDELYPLAGSSAGAQLRLHRLDPCYRIRWHGEEREFLFTGNREAMMDQIGQFSAADARRYDAFVDHSRRVYEEAILVAGRRSFLSVLDLARMVPGMARLGALRSVHNFVSGHFKEPHIQQAFGFHPLFIGGDPFRVPAVYAALAYLQIKDGVWYSEGGVSALVRSLAGLIVQAGGEILTSERVERILETGSRVCGVITEGGRHLPADLVVSNADVVETQEKLLGRGRGARPRLTMSCLLLYLGSRRAIPQLAHHTLLVGREYRSFVTAVTRGKHLPKGVSLYVHAPARTESAMAPPGGESLAVLLPVPNLAAGYDWANRAEELAEQVIAEMESAAGLGLDGLSGDLEVRRMWTPLDFRDRLGAVDGNAFGPEPTLTQSASFRQPNRDRRFGGLYHVGAGTHPGAGIPGVLLSAQVTAELVASDLLERSWL